MDAKETLWTLAQVIAQLKDHRASHQSWLTYYDSNPNWTSETYKAVQVGDPDFQKKCLVAYDHMILVLESLDEKS